MCVLILNIFLTFERICRLMLNMAMVADDDDYAHVVLICSGQFNDPNFEGRLTHITRQLHMLTTGCFFQLLV